MAAPSLLAGAPPAATSTAAPTPEAPAPIASGCSQQKLKDVVKAYDASAYDAKTWKTFQAALGEILRSPTSGNPGETIEAAIAADAATIRPPIKHPVHSFVFVRKSAPDQVVTRVLYRAAPPVDVEAASLGGARFIYEVLLSERADTVLERSYTVSRKENPALSKLSKFVSTIGGAGQAPALRETAGACAGTFVSAYRIPIRFERATVKINDVVQNPPAKVKERAEKLKDQVVVWPGSASACAKEIGLELNKALHQSPNVEPLRVEKVLDELETAYYATFSTPECKSAGLAQASAIREVYDNFRALITAPKGVKGETTYENAPPTSWSFGLVVAGAVGGTWPAQRAKVNNGVFVADPFSNPLTAATFNWYLCRADPLQQDKPLGRPNVFFGATLTPDIGITGGIAVGLIKDLKLTCGYAFVRSDVLRGEDQLNGPPSNPGDPLRKSLVGTFFVGAGYAFE